LYTPSTGALVPVATGPGQQRFADVSAAHVAWTDFSVGPGGVFTGNGTDLANVAVLDRATHATNVRMDSGKRAFPMLGAPGKIAYLAWGLIPPEPKFSEYDLRIGDVSGTAATDVVVEHIVTEVPYVRPVARGTYLEWVAFVAGSSVLRRQAVDLATPAQTVSQFAAATVFGPTASDAMTLVGATSQAGTVLRAFAR
jgi:hypothetical protein